MKTPKLAIAMGYIDDDLVSGAVEYKPSLVKLVWFRYVAAVACLCLVLLGAIKITISLFPKSNTNTPVYGVLGEVVAIKDDGRYDVRITGEDQNFAKGDIVTINYDYVSNESGNRALKTGDIIAITYSTYEKTGTTYQITPGQIDIVQTSSD
ncbi:MAG TPA: hypothetical protein GXX37_13550 [Clostridiaceae bacterium]|nr:hypothetical protein [Clostridiaceae bacterium]